MAIINKIKCARCDRKYSGVRSRCPFCGARRTGSGKYSDDSNGSNFKMLVSVLIMAVFTVAAGILLITTPVEADAGRIPESPPQLNNPEDDINNQESLVPEPTPEPTPEPPPAPTKLTAIEIRNEWGRATADISISPGEMVSLQVFVEPESVVENSDMRITWESSDTDIFVVAPEIYKDRNWKATISGISRTAGTAELTVTVGDPDNGGILHTIKIRIKP